MSANLAFCRRRVLRSIFSCQKRMPLRPLTQGPMARFGADCNYVLCFFIENASYNSTAIEPFFRAAANLPARQTRPLESMWVVYGNLITKFLSGVKVSFSFG